MEELQNPVPEETAEVVDIQFRPGQKVYYFDPDGLRLEPGDHVVMDTARGPEFGICAGGNHVISAREVVSPLRKILRRATPQDEKINTENRARERHAFEVCTQKISQHQLDMQLVSAEYAFDGSKILFYFTADERVDFRELVKDLAYVFHTRIELRQIGVRDKAKMVGGLGICGRPFCCASFLEDFQPVSIKMAKTQNLSLNPTKISGTCGRLMCCLKYEQDTYEDLIRSSPKVESFVDTPDGRGTVVESQLLHGRVKVRMENSPETVGVYSNDDIAVLRSGKARKNDPPIPDDLAPISGGGRPAKKKEPEAAPVLEPIRFRYSTETIAEEQSVVSPEQTPAEEAPGQEPGRSRRNRRRGPRPEQNAEPAGAEQSSETEQGAGDHRPHRENRRQNRRENPADHEKQRERSPKNERAQEKSAEKEQDRPAEKGQEQSAENGAPHSDRPRRADRRRQGRDGRRESADAGRSTPREGQQNPRQNGGQTDRQNDRQNNRQADRQNDRQSDRQSDRQNDASQPSAEGTKKPDRRPNYRHRHRQKPPQE